MARFTVLAALAAVAGCTTPTFEGKVVDAITGEAHGGTEVVLSSRQGDQVSLTCMKKAGPIADDGTFKIEVCPNAYDLSFTDEELWAADFPGIEAGADLSQPVEIKVWHAPKGNGVYIFKPADSALETVKTGADMASELALNDREQKIYYPTGLKNISKVPTDAHVVITGTYVDGFDFVPLIRSEGGRKFAGKTEDHAPNVYPDPWWFVGVEFTTDTEWTRKEAQLDASKVVKKTQGDRSALVIEGSALPTGRYLFQAKTNPKRAFIMDWGNYEAPE